MKMITKANLTSCRAILSFLLISVSTGPLYGEDWKHQVTFPDDPFCQFGTSAGDSGWVKFTIKLDNPGTVYFQDSTRYLLHHDFATQLLPPFIGMSPSDYYQVTLYTLNQQASLGAVIMPPLSGYPPVPDFPEYGIQFVRYDPYTREEIRDMFNVVKATVTAGPDVEAFYFPTYEQQAVAGANRDWFEAEGIRVSSTSRWARGNSCYSEGWALGELKFFEADQIDAAYQGGLLEPNDILLTDGVPAEIPFVAGIISLAPSTPSSHVAILAQAYNIPFVHLALTDDANRARQFIGRTIVFSVYAGYFGQCDLKMIDVDDVLTPPQIAEILDLKTPADLDISAIAPYGAYSAGTEDLLPADIQYFGGKAANFGMLRQAIPDNSPKAIALSFNLWREFLSQAIVPQAIAAGTLGEEIANRLSAYTYPPPDMAALSKDLSTIRSLIKNADMTRFTPEQVLSIKTVLQANFDPNEKIRFRSSTNVEDSEQFTGAGLYDSYSGCLADELDGDDGGPCRCDPNETDERGVFRAIRKVFASFYNDNAFLERLRHGVNESEVGMGLLVHHSFPDEIERANGVATLTKGSYSKEIMLVTQLGATSVSNPEPGSIPEEVRVGIYSFGMYPSIVRPSSLVPLGTTVMEWEEDYKQLAQLLVTTSEKFEQVTGQTQYVLDFEYKKVSPGGAALPAGGLVVKQIRQIPQPGTTKDITPFLINQPTEYCVYQGEVSSIGSVFAMHRLKSKWEFETKNIWLNKSNLSKSFYAQSTIEYADNGRVRTLDGKLSQLPFATYSFADNFASDRWRMHHLVNPRDYALQTGSIPGFVSSAECPLLTLDDFEDLRLNVDYDTPVILLDYQGKLITTTTESVSLRPCPQPQSGDLLQQRTSTAGDITISTSFYWPPYPTGPTAGYTAPLVKFVETTITGYTTEPIVLHGYYSGTYGPGHHNFNEFFIFEPRLEPGISQRTLDQLKAQDIRLIYAATGMGTDMIKTYGFGDGSFIPGDFEPDGDVDLVDFGGLAVRWLDTACDTCGQADLTGDGDVDMDDLFEFASHWLWEE
ncbi:MAG: hypothetical protein K9M57_10150 [Phycisphaerae bacterium]|nr:hypothetical protein [Phycisphaerae bacterium]